jgi:hypothetical protein
MATAVGFAIGKRIKTCRSCGMELLRFSRRGCVGCGAKGLDAYGPLMLLPPFLFLLVGLLILGYIWYVEIRPRQQAFEETKQQIQQRNP